MDKSRGWVNPSIQKTMAGVLQESPKIVATVRNVDACAASFAKIAKPEKLADFLNNNQVINHLKESYVNLKEGYEKYPENILFVEYEDLVSNPQEVILRIEKFWDLQHFDHTFDNIDGKSVKEDDENAWGIPGLHDIRKELKSTASSPEEILGEYTYRFKQPAFWRGEELKRDHPLDKALDFALEGKFKLAEELLKTNAVGSSG